MIQPRKASKKMINNFSKSTRNLKLAKKIIPSASQTYSKSYKYFCEGRAPVFLEKGKGGHVWDIDGNKYLDFVCGLGAITLGYNHPAVNKAVKTQLRKGISFSQSNLLELELAQKLVKIIPCAQMVKFVKNGSDATTAAVRLARAYTNKEIIFCCGYHGYHDWYIGTTSNSLGIPKAIKNLTKTFIYNDIDSFIRLFNKYKRKVAAVILEPSQLSLPKNNFLQKVKKITHQNQAILIFDEVVSGFRLSLGGAQEYYHVTSDLAAVGKGMGNGLPISALVGKAEIMKLIDKGVFISTTFGGEALSLAGALAVIKVLEQPGAFKHIWSLGENWKKGMQVLIKKQKLEKIIKIIGADPHCGVSFSASQNLTGNDLFSVFQQELIKSGILTTGINNFCLAHTKKDIKDYLSAADFAFITVKEAIKKNSLKGILKGRKFRPIFRRN